MLKTQIRLIINDRFYAIYPFSPQNARNRNPRYYRRDFSRQKLPPLAFIALKHKMLDKSERF